MQRVLHIYKSRSLEQKPFSTHVLIEKVANVIVSLPTLKVRVPVLYLVTPKDAPQAHFSGNISGLPQASSTEMVQTFSLPRGTL
jgi:hypothetical protein